MFLFIIAIMVFFGETFLIMRAMIRAGGVIVGMKMLQVMFRDQKRPEHHQKKNRNFYSG